MQDLARTGREGKGTGERRCMCEDPEAGGSKAGIHKSMPHERELERFNGRHNSGSHLEPSNLFHPKQKPQKAVVQ